MKLLRLKITDPKGFRSLQAGFEYYFRSEWDLQDEQGFAPFVCAGPNGSGKSNLLEVLATIFYHLECIYLENLPDSFVYDKETNPDGFQGLVASPDAFELEYIYQKVYKNYYTPAISGIAVAGRTLAGETGYRDRIVERKILVTKELDKSPTFVATDIQDGSLVELNDRKQIREILPEYILGYSSGENEILSLPFFKMRFIQFDEYLQALKEQFEYPGRPESRMIYLDSSFSQAILLCNLLFHDDETLQLFRDDVGIEALREFRIIIQRSIDIDEEQLPAFGSQDESQRESIEDIVRNNPALIMLEDEDGSKRTYRVNLMALLEGDETASPRKDGIINRLRRCATCWYLDEVSDTLYLDYFVNDATKQAFSENFDFEVNKSPIELFQALQVLLTLNLYTVSERLKSDLYKSESLYVGETVPTLASDQRIMRIKHFWIKKTNSDEPVLLKSLSDGEHQLLHSLGLCLLFRNTSSLFLLDEPETHFNPDWRANFATRLQQCFKDFEDSHEMLVTTHTPFLISDSEPEKVLVFKKDKKSGQVNISKPDYNTLGASINKITMNTFNKRETIGGRAQSILEDMRKRFEDGEDKDLIINEINRQLGDSVEKVLLVKTILNSMEAQN